MTEVFGISVTRYEFVFAASIIVDSVNIWGASWRFGLKLLCMITDYHDIDSPRRPGIGAHLLLRVLALLAALAG